MNQIEAIKFFEDVMKIAVTKSTKPGFEDFATGQPVFVYQRSQAVDWFTQAETALFSVIPEEHPVRLRWNKIVNGTGFDVENETDFEDARALFQSVL